MVHYGFQPRNDNDGGFVYKDYEVNTYEDDFMDVDVDDEYETTSDIDEYYYYNDEYCDYD